jgi:hypothetical protein
LYGTTVEWFTFPSAIEVGLVDFDKAPSFLMDIKGQKLPMAHTILFRNKKASIAFAKSMSPDSFPPFLGPSRSRSRYSLIQDPSTNRLFLLLNLGAIEKPAGFFIDFLRVFLEEMQRLNSNRELDDALTMAVGRCYFGFNAKIGIPFVYADEDTSKFVLMLIANVKSAYATAIAISRAINQKNLDQAESFISHRLSLIYPSFKKLRPLVVERALELIAYYVDIVLILESVIRFSDLRGSIAAQIDNWKKGIGRSDASFARFMPLVDSTFQAGESLRGIDAFANSLSKVIVMSFDLLSPQLYHRPQEVSALIQATDLYTEAVANGRAWKGPLGNTEEFLSLQNRILTKNLDPEMEIYVRWGILVILITQAESGDKTAYERALPHIHKFIISLDSSLSAVTIRNRSFPFTYEDGGVLLLALSHLALLYGDSVNHYTLRKDARKFAGLHKAIATLVQCDWISYLETGEVTYLQQIRRLLNENDSNFKKQDLTTQIIWLLSASVLEEDKRPIYLDMADQLAIDIIADSQPKGIVHVFASRMNSELFALVVGLFRAVLTLVDARNTSRLDELKSHASAILELRALHAERVLALRSIAVHNLLSGQGKLRPILDQLLDLARGSELLENFAHAIDEFTKAETPAERIAAIYRYKLNNLDPWDLVLQSYFTLRLPELVNELKPEEGLLLVEGPTDVAVLQTMRTKLGLGRVLICPIGGYANAPYFLASSSVLESVTKKKIPMFIILDGDVRADKAESITRRLGSGIGQYMIERISRRTIEEFLLVPGAIKRAFPEMEMTENEIASVIAENREGDKKEVLQTVLEKGKVKLVYGPAVAGRIASAMKSDEIDAELARLLWRTEEFLKKRR